MARLGSQQIAGYYPTPTSLLTSFASILRWPERPVHGAVLLDPCAGSGEAVATLREQWARRADGEGDEPPSFPSILACELERERAEGLQKRLTGSYDQVFHTDAFLLQRTQSSESGATVLYLNPPYDHDPEEGRLEQRFLRRFTRFLHPGSGFLFYLVPHGSLVASADTLAREYLDLRAWRLPEPEFSRFRQVLVVGRRVRRRLPSGGFRDTILRWAEKPETLPVLPDRCPEPFEVPADPEEGSFGLSFRVDSLDLTAAVDGFRPWEGEPVGTGFSARELLGARYQTAVPPKPAHIALALASGMFNGHHLEPNDPERHPPVLAKGTFERERIEISQKVNQDGDVTGSVQVERPRLRLTLLRLDRGTFHTLAAGTVPAGGDDPEGWNAADLIAGYDRSLARLLGEQFPALHDPADREGQIALPELPRSPYRVQAQAIQAALKLLATGRNPFFVAEVGTGKSTMALSVAAALAPENHAATTAELRRVGLAGKLPRVRRTLIVCPPHLLSSWREQAAAVLPGARVQVLRKPSDLDSDAEIYLLSRETAKLGHAFEGIEGRCPRCGAAVETSAKENATRRLRCRAVTHRPRNLAARLAEHLALLLAPQEPDHPLVAGLLRGRVLRRLLERYREEPEEGTSRTVRPTCLRPFHAELLRHVVDLYGRVEETESTSDRARLLSTLLDILPAVAAAAGELEVTRRALESALGEEGPQPSEIYAWRPKAWLRRALMILGDYTGADLESDASGRPSLLPALEALHAAGSWTASRRCGEPLYQAAPRPRRYPLAQRILRRYRHRFDLLVIDEAHEMANAASAQSKAAHRLSALPGVPTLVLTGSLMGGYASSLFANFWALSPDFRQELGRDEKPAFIARYGYRKVLETREGKRKPRDRGAHTDRELLRHRTIGEAPGIHPTFLLRHLLPTAVLVHKEDLDAELPPLTEAPAPIEVDAAGGEDPRARELLAEYRRLERILLDRIRRDRFQPERAGRLLGALVELPSYLDRAAADLGPFEIRDPETLGGGLIATGKGFPAGWRTPKERWLLAEICRLREAGEKVLVFLRHTGTPELPRRLLGLLSEDGTDRAVWLDTKKVSTAKRHAWIDRNVLARDVDVLLVNPNAVRTGLNNLVAFSTAIWYELDYSATTYRQACGRLHRIGQTRPVSIQIPYYAGTAQEVAFRLVAKKVSASLQVDGLDLQAALEAAGASEEETDSMATAMSLGQAVYAALTGEMA